MLATEYCALDPRVEAGSRVISDTVFAEDAPTEYCSVHTEQTTVTICLDDPVLDENGKETGIYHLAGEFCPEESQKQVAYLNYDRQNVGGARTGDSAYLYVEAELAGPCTIHTEETMDDPENPPFDITDPSTWPFNPFGPEDPEGQPGGEDDPGAHERPDGPDSNEEPLINPETGLPYGL